MNVGTGITLTRARSLTMSLSFTTRCLGIAVALCASGFLPAELAAQAPSKVLVVNTQDA